MAHALQLSLEDRLQRISRILDESDNGFDPISRNKTGFVPANSDMLIVALTTLLESINPLEHRSLDLGCGLGNWSLLSAAAGIPSYGIEVNAELVKQANKNYRRAIHENLISKETPFRIVEGNIYTNGFLKDYESYISKHHYPIGRLPFSRINPYPQLGISPKDATIIYTFMWMAQLPILVNFLKEGTSETASYVLPYNGHDIKELFQIERVSMDSIVWKRKLMFSR